MDTHQEKVLEVQRQISLKFQHLRVSQYLLLIILIVVPFAMVATFCFQNNFEVWRNLAAAQFAWFGVSWLGVQFGLSSLRRTAPALLMPFWFLNTILLLPSIYCASLEPLIFKPVFLWGSAFAVGWMGIMMFVAMPSIKQEWAAMAASAFLSLILGFCTVVYANAFLDRSKDFRFPVEVVERWCRYANRGNCTLTLKPLVPDVDSTFNISVHHWPDWKKGDQTMITMGTGRLNLPWVRKLDLLPEHR